MNRWHRGLIERLDASGKELIWYAYKFSNAEIGSAPAPNEWSIHQVLSHLRDTERNVFLYRAPRILNEDAPRVPNFDQESWMREHYSASEPLDALLKDFSGARRKLIARLKKTKDDDWARVAIHPEYGRITLEWLVTHCYNHTLEHIAQLGYGYEKRLLKRS
ncbi:MAG: DinB family protein [Chloroflexi bacterium]|nr:DinB family protein [Chloroflexota bacterium]